MSASPSSDHDPSSTPATTVKDPVHLRIRRPIPIDVASALTSAISLLYPDSHIVEASGHDALHIVIERGAPTDHQALSEIEKAEVPEGADTEVDRISPDGYLLHPAARIGATIAEALRDLIRQQEPENYLQFTYRIAGDHMEEGDTAYYMVVARMKEQSPWALHQAAEARLSAVREIAQGLPDDLRATILAAAGEPEPNSEERA